MSIKYHNKCTWRNPYHNKDFIRYNEITNTNFLVIMSKLLLKITQLHLFFTRFIQKIRNYCRFSRWNLTHYEIRNLSLLFFSLFIVTYPRSMTSAAVVVPFAVDCHCLFLRVKFVEAGIRSPIIPHGRQTFSSNRHSRGN